jgi:hypothetical protein
MAKTGMGRKRTVQLTLLAFEFLFFMVNIEVNSSFSLVVTPGAL